MRLSRSMAWSRSQLAGCAFVAVAALAGCGSTVAMTSQVGGAGLSDQSGLNAGSATGGNAAPPTAAGPGGAGSSGFPQAQIGSTTPGTPGSGGVSPTGGSVTTGGVGSAGRLTTPVEIGVFTENFTAASAAITGADTSTGASDKQIYEAMIAGLNKQGGLAGRKIKPVVYEMDGSGSNFETKYAAACARFTQDHHVAAVVAVNHYDESFISCLNKAGVPIFSQSIHSPAGDVLNQSQYPGYFAPTNMNADAHIEAVLAPLAASGYLTGKNKLGVLVEGCAFLERSYTRTLVPLARRIGIPVFRQDTQCLTGFSDQVGPYASQIQNAVLKWRTEGVDRVFLLGRSESATMLGVAAQADSQHWYPGYAVSSDAIPQGSLAGLGVVPKSQLVNIRGMGWVGVPGLDVAIVPPLPAAQKQAQARCRALAQAGGLSNGADGLVFEDCDPLMLLVAAMKASGGQGGTPALRRAVEAVGTSFVGAIAGPTRFGPDRHYGVLQVRPFAYDTGCSCFAYTGPFRAIR